MTASPTPGPVPRLVPVWLDRLAAAGWRLLVTIVMGLVLVAIAIELSTVTAGVLVSLVVGAALAPTVRGLRARGVSRSVAAAVASALGLAVLAATILLALLGVVPSIRDLARAVADGVRDVRDQLDALGLPDVLLAGFDRLVAAVAGLVRVDLGALTDPAITIGTVAVLAVFLTYFVLQDGDRGWALAMRSLRPWQAEAVTASAVEGLDRVGAYLRRTALLAAVDAVVVGAALALAGAPLLGPLVVVVFLSGFVPYLGAIAAAATVGLATLALVGPGASVLVLAAMAASFVVSTRLLARTSLGSRVDVHPVLVLLAIPAGAALFGILGLVAVLPVTVFALAVSKSVVVALGILPPDAQPPTRAGWAVPVWLDRLAQWSWRGLVVVGLAWVTILLIVRIPGIVIPAVLALVTAATLAPVVARLRRAGWSASLAAAATTAGASVLVVAAVGLTIAWTISPMQEILATALEGADDLDLAWLIDAIRELDLALTIDVAGILGGLVGLALSLAIALLLTYFFLRDGPMLWDAVMRPVQGARREHLDHAGRRTVDILAGYMRGTAIISLFGGVTSGLIMVFLGLPLAVPIGVLTFFGGFIPYIGSFVTTALAFLVAVAVGTTTDIVVMGVFTVVFNLIQGSGVAPVVYGKTLSLHPAIVLLAVPIGGEIAGILGMFLVVPIAAIISATWRLVLASIEDDSPGSGAVAAEGAAVVEPAPT